VFAPQPPDERVYRHDLVGSRQQKGQQQAFLRPPQRDRAVVSLDLQRPKHPKPHGLERNPPPAARTGPNGPSACPATGLPPGHHRPATGTADAATRPTATTDTAREEVVMQLDPPANRGQARRRLRAVLAWSGLTLLAALAIALTLVIATLA
jgi:hypothetical protein